MWTAQFAPFRQGCDRGREEERLEAKGGWEGHLQGPHVQRRSGGHHGQGQDDHRSDQLAEHTVCVWKLHDQRIAGISKSGLRGR